MNVQLELLENISGRPLGTVDVPLGCAPTDEVAVARRLVAIGRAVVSLELDCLVHAAVDGTDVELMIVERAAPTGPDGYPVIDIDARALTTLSGAGSPA